MSYVALYRKFRPRTFDEVKGQEHITKTLRNQVITGRLQHAYLFCGTRGTGKTSVAKILARAVNCENLTDGNPCGACESCRRIQDAISMNVIEIDAASNNGVDNIREIIEEVQYRPTDGRYKVYIIDEVHMLSGGAFNALLKTLEEPPSYVIFILATTEAAKIPVTILSRCQRYDFRRIDTDTITNRMAELLSMEGAEAEDRALRFIARAADGSMRDALSLLDRCIAFYMGETLTYEKVLRALGEADTSVFASLTESIMDGDAGAVIRLFGKQVGRGAEVGQFISDFMQFLRNLMIAASSDEQDAEAIIDATGEQMQELKEIAARTDPDTVMRFIRILAELQNRMRYASNRRVLAETSLLMMTKPQGDSVPDAIYQRLRELERRVEELTLKLAEGVPAAAPVPAAAAPVKEAEEGEVLPDAAPDDLKRICGEWNRLVSSLPPSILKQQLANNAHPQYNAETLENRLYVEFAGGMQETAAEVANQESWRLEFEKHIEKQYGKHVDVEFHLAKTRSKELHTVDVERMMAEGILMTVEVDDADEEQL